MAAAEGVRAPRLRPLSLGEILDVAIKICVSHRGTLLKAVLIVVIPVQIVSTIVTISTVGDDYSVTPLDFSTATATPDEQADELGTYFAGLMINVLLQLLAALLATAACFRAIATAYLGQPSDWRSSLRFAVSCAPALLWLTFLYGIAVAFATLVFILPGVWLYVAFAFAVPALLVENVRGTKALGRSFALVRGQWWRIFGILIVGFFLAGVIAGIVQGAFALILLVGIDSSSLSALVISSLAGAAALVVSTPIQAAIQTVVYFDMRVRKEAFDLELLAAQIGAEGDIMEAVASPATSGFPTADEIDRSEAPFWPPPPGWTPPSRTAGGTPDLTKRPESDNDDLPAPPGAPYG